MSTPLVLPSGYAFGGADTERAILEVWKCDNAAYGSANISLKTLRAWFKAYQQGGFYLWYDGKIIAGIGLWPLQENVFYRVREASLSEEELGPELLVHATTLNVVPHWYLSGVFVEPSHRRSWVLPQLLIGRFTRWAASGHGARQCRILGLALSEGGTGVLRRLGFSRCLLDSHSLPPYELEIEYPDGIAAITARITRAYSSDNRKLH